MMKFRNNKRWGFCYGGLITQFLRAKGIRDEEELDMNVSRVLYLICNIVDVTHTKALDTSNGPVLYAQERKAIDDSWMAHMFGMAELIAPVFQEPLDDDEDTADEAMEVVDANALMVFDKATDAADGCADDNEARRCKTP
uniref:Uncharacterized protein n=1 Tax=Solanum tuberosum TaxID=4113 RepID=M1DU91_SOLTU